MKELAGGIVAARLLEAREGWTGRQNNYLDDDDDGDDDDDDDDDIK